MIADDDDRTFLSRARSSRGVMTGGHCVIMLNIGTGSGMGAACVSRFGRNNIFPNYNLGCFEINL